MFRGFISSLFFVYLQAIHAGGIVTGMSANSGAVACGGLLCRPLTGLYTRDPLPEDAYIHVAMIPAGASNISITELKNSMNLLGKYEGNRATLDFCNYNSTQLAYSATYRGSEICLQW